MCLFVYVCIYIYIYIHICIYGLMCLCLFVYRVRTCDFGAEGGSPNATEVRHAAPREHTSANYEKHK